MNETDRYGREICPVHGVPRPCGLCDAKSQRETFYGLTSWDDIANRAMGA